MQKKAFKVFNKESKQDCYSAKRLLDRAFFPVKSQMKKLIDIGFVNSPYFSHTFLGEESLQIFVRKNLDNRRIPIVDNENRLFCLFCGFLLG